MKRLLAVIIFFIVAIIIAVIWWNNGASAVNDKDKTPQIFVVKNGDGVREIANSLKTKNLIKDPIVFFLIVRKLGLDKKIQAGDFRLNPSMTAEEIAQNLTHGTLDIWVTIPEGKRAQEIAEILESKIPSYKPLFIDILAQNEGYLFPDTYLIPRDADIALIVSLMRKNFDNKYQTIQSKTQLSKNDVVIIASLVEREAKFKEDRPLVASVIMNRLKIGMKLDIDATVQYALGYQRDQKTWWKKDLTIDDLKINSPYNTYINPGLPPAPIANPGIEALKAVLNPQDSEYLYYISDKSGHNHYAKTSEEHDANAKKYLKTPL